VSEIWPLTFACEQLRNNSNVLKYVSFFLWIKRQIPVSSWDFLRLKHLCWSSDGGQTLVCAFLTSLFKREATASHHLLNSPIRYKATVTHEGWVCVLLAVLSTFVSFVLKSS